MWPGANGTFSRRLPAVTVLEVDFESLVESSFSTFSTEIDGTELSELAAIIVNDSEMTQKMGVWEVIPSSVEIEVNFFSIFDLNSIFDILHPAVPLTQFSALQAWQTVTTMTNDPPWIYRKFGIEEL